MTVSITPQVHRSKFGVYQVVQTILGVLFSIYLLWRIYDVFFGHPSYGPDTWARFAISGIILGSVYALIAIGYTLVYGILFMINFAPGNSPIMLPVPSQSRRQKKLK